MSTGEPLALVQPSNGLGVHPAPIAPTASATEQRDRLYDLLAEQGREHSELLRDMGSKLDKLTEACSGMSGKIEALAVAPSLIRVLVVSLVLGLAGLSIMVGRSIAVDLGWVSVKTESSQQSSSDEDGASTDAASNAASQAEPSAP